MQIVLYTVFCFFFPWGVFDCLEHQNCVMQSSIVNVSEQLERMWKEVVVDFLRYYPSIRMEGLSKTTKCITYIVAIHQVELEGLSLVTCSGIFFLLFGL
jgi:hypothetical protein